MFCVIISSQDFEAFEAAIEEENLEEFLKLK